MGKTKRDRRYYPERSCGKWRYPSRAVAERLRKRLMREQGERFFVYGCVECGAFHLTSKGRGRDG